MARAIHQITSWVKSPSDGSTICRVSARSLGSLQTVSEYERTEIEQKGEKLIAEEIIEACENWTDGVQKEVTFIGQWLSATDRPLKSMQWRVQPSLDGSSTGFPVADGTPESILAQMQVYAAKKDELQLNMLKAFVDMQIQSMNSMREHVERLESREAELVELKQNLAETSVLDSNPAVEQRINKIMDVLSRALLPPNAQK